MFEALLARWDNTSLHLNRTFFLILSFICGLFALGFIVSAFVVFSQVLLLGLVVIALSDCVALYYKRGVSAKRILNPQFYLNEENRISIEISNNYVFAASGFVLDELPVQLSQHGAKRPFSVDAISSSEINYAVTPKHRGDFNFGVINLYVRGPFRLVSRRFRQGSNISVKVYPSFPLMRRFQLLAVANDIQQSGVRRMRRVGHTLEFENIREYVRGDDVRSINWKASARRSELMVNNYTDEKSQQVYCLINKGRMMKSHFDGMTLMDHSINAALAITGVALQRGDRAGLICFSEQIDAFIAANNRATQVKQVMEVLYNQTTNFAEPDYEKLFKTVRHRINHRSLLVLFTNYESIYSLDHDLPFLKRMARYHLLVVVMFENTELKQLTTEQARTTEDIYIQTIAEKFGHEKQLMVRQLQQNGIIGLLTTPADLTINLINKYIEVKNRQFL